MLINNLRKNPTKIQRILQKKIMMTKWMYRAVILILEAQKEDASQMMMSK